ncbi:MAG: hypothetical protein RJA07_2711 [Bacteroidota bacterium]|jgi:hypothetical protein
MRNFFFILLIAVLVLLMQWWLPWYTLAIPTFIVGFLYKSKSAFPVFLLGFIAVFLLWFIMIFFINQNNHSILANRLSILFFKHQWVVLLMIVNSFIGGIVAAMAMLSGFYLRKTL